MKLCKDCAHSFIDWPEDPEHLCYRPVHHWVDPATGLYRTEHDGRLCRVARGNGEPCGPDAVFFMEKEVQRGVHTKYIVWSIFAAAFIWFVVSLK